MAAPAQEIFIKAADQTEHVRRQQRVRTWLQKTISQDNHES